MKFVAMMAERVSDLFTSLLTGAGNSEYQLVLQSYLTLK